MNEIERRRAAVIKTEARFKDRPFDWSKQATCIHLLRFHAAQMGHKLPLVPKFRSALGARKALLATGFQTLPAWLDSRFDRIPPAFARVGDVLAMPGDEGFEGLLIKADRHKFLGWHECAEGCEFMEVRLEAALGAWRL